MIGLGTLVNMACILLGGIGGLLFGRFLTERCRSMTMTACGVSLLFIGGAGTLQKMLIIEDGQLSSYGSIMLALCLTLGSLLGEWLDLERHVERLGQWLKKISGSSGDTSFVSAFVTASLTVCVGAMAIIGSINEGIYGDHSILFAKAILDLILILLLTASYGKGCLFSALPVGIWQGLVTVLSHLIASFLTDAAVTNLSLVGNVLIFCIGINMVWDKKIRISNMLPSVFLAILWAYLPVSL